MSTDQIRSLLCHNDPITELCHGIETSFKSTSLGPDSWYLLTITCLSGSPDPELAKDLYLHVIQKEKSSTSAARQAFIRRIREALVKCVSIVGCCKPIEAIISISQYRAIYTRDEKSTLGHFDAHRDFQWISKEITYGLYLSDRQVFNDVETEIIEGDPLAYWRTRRIGVSKEDTQVLWECIQRVARIFDLKMNKVPTVDAVEYDV
ncbi:hypothetical protein F9C07_2199271 [Aspergillus flavus]|uniref:Uncharacterized protein n=1 Tax=Aspergillus flavus (strain ATCC 200026 / FGSC A1120 / IAM 13836 / NRRL 3357 / JCM 12722 / SRRC 167) TaxID=332952 RepID=A0A7U2QX03_ASPFN|nr:hypothetical protein F9C07_2199271 [Aspergillus flavus]